MSSGEKSDEKEKSPSGRFEDDLTNYKPGLILTNPHHNDFLEFDKTPQVDRLLKQAEPGAANLSDSFETYVSRSFASAYDKFDSDPNIRKLVADSKLANQQKFKSKYAKQLSEDELDLTADSLKSLYTEYNNERTKNYEFDVYQPKAFQTREYNNPKNTNVSIREVSRFKKESSPANLESSVSGYKTRFESLVEDPAETSREDRASRYKPARERQVIIDTSKYGKAGRRGVDDDCPTSFPRNEFLRKNDSMYVGSNFVMLTLRSPDRWYDKVDKLLKEARDT